mgnify:CR=1 FL=1
MNAGAHDCETWERVLAVRTIDRFGQIYERTPDEYEIGYRMSAVHLMNGLLRQRFPSIRR